MATYMIKTCIILYGSCHPRTNHKHLGALRGIIRHCCGQSWVATLGGHGRHQAYPRSKRPTWKPMSYTESDIFLGKICCKLKIQSHEQAYPKNQRWQRPYGRTKSTINSLAICFTLGLLLFLDMTEPSSSFNAK